MAGKSAGILLFRKANGNLEVLLVHPGGPFWKNKDLAAWSIPKGEYADDEDALAAAVREFEEETGMKISGEFFPLKPVKQKGGKIVQAFALEHDADVSNIKSNFFEMEWPPRSGKRQSFPEVDKAQWFSIDEAKLKINSAQVQLLEELAEKVSAF